MLDRPEISMAEVVSVVTILDPDPAASLSAMIKSEKPVA